MKSWFVYILECRDGTFYTGISDNVKGRVAVHDNGKGAKYTQGRRPVVLRFMEKVKGRSEASKREAVIKKMSRKRKMGLW
jgi:putative endonuclease